MEGHRNNSKKRDAVLSLLRSTKAHPSAEMLFSVLKAGDPGLGIATVYRNLSILQQEGVIRSVGSVDGQERYDADLHPHGHFVCSLCGSVLDFELPEAISSSLSGPALPEGCVVSGLELRLEGTCPECSVGRQ